MWTRITKRSVLVASGLLSLAVILVGTWSLSRPENADSSAEKRPPSTKAYDNHSQISGDKYFPGYDADNKPVPPEISLDQAINDTSIKVIVPKYLPAGAQLEVIRRNEVGTITLYYGFGEGDDWIQIGVWKQPKQPDYEKDIASITTKAERVLPNGTKEPVTVNSGVVVAIPQPDGTLEPVGKDKHQLVTVNGMLGHYNESIDVGTVRLGKNPRLITPRNMAGLFIWKNGMEYGIGGSNISRSEILKITGSMF